MRFFFFLNVLFGKFRLWSAADVFYINQLFLLLLQLLWCLCASPGWSSCIHKPSTRWSFAIKAIKKKIRTQCSQCCFFFLFQFIFVPLASRTSPPVVFRKVWCVIGVERHRAGLLGTIVVCYWESHASSEPAVLDATWSLWQPEPSPWRRSYR